MTQAQLDHRVARHTGESLRTIRRLGFHAVAGGPDDLEPEDLLLAVDCPFCGVPAPWPDGTVSLAECPRCDVEFEFLPEEVYAASPEAITSAA